MAGFNVFRGSVSKGKLELAKREEFKKALRDLEFSDKPIEIAIAVGNYYDLISKGQLGYYWSYLMVEISERTGEAPKRLHKIFQDLFLSEGEVFNELPQPRLQNYILQIIGFMAKFDIILFYPDEVMVPNYKQIKEQLK